MSLVKNISKRDERQLELAHQLINRKKGCIEAITGFGKTRTALIALAKIRNLIETVIVIVPTKNLKIQWESQLQRFDFYYEVLVINTARKRKALIADVIILDEVHNFASEKSLPAIRQAICTYMWGLSATIERQDERHVQIYAICPLIDRVGIEEGHKYGYISPFRVYNLAITLTGKDREEYNQINDRYHHYFAFFDHKFSTANGIIQNPSYAKNYAKRLSMEPGQVIGLARSFMKYMNLRRTFLYNHETKIEAACEIASKMQGKIITFGSNVEMVNELTKRMGKEAKAYHSGQSKTTRENTLRKFNETEEIRILNTARALDEGADIQGLENAIVCSGTSTKRQNIQRLGRIIRAKQGKQALMVNIFIENTQDEKWLNSRLGGVPSITVHHTDEINF